MKCRSGERCGDHSGSKRNGGASRGIRPRRICERAAGGDAFFAETAGNKNFEDGGIEVTASMRFVEQ